MHTLTFGRGPQDKTSLGERRTVALKVPVDLLAAVDEVARLEGTSRSEIVRVLLRELLEARARG